MCKNSETGKCNCNKSDGSCNCGNKNEKSKCKSSSCSCQSNIIKKASPELINLLKVDLDTL